MGINDNSVMRMQLKSRILRIRYIRAHPGVLPSLKKYYARHCSDFIKDWMITYDPRNLDLPYMPFLLWDRQIELVQWINDRVDKREDGLVEKTRDWGVSYISIAWSVWALLYKPGIKIGFGSRKEKLVDEIGNPDSLFEKARIILECIPVEFKPDMSASHMKIINRSNGCSITGEAGDNIGRGGRNTVYFKDESAFYERPQKIDAALSMNSDVKIDISTPCGMGNPFSTKRFSNKYPVFVCDWRDDPRKDQEWYDKQTAILEPWIVAQEIDRDYSASIEGICIPAKYVMAAIDFPLKAEGIKVAGFDVADEGQDANALTLRHGPVVTKIMEWRVGTTTQSTRKVVSICGEGGYDRMHYESNGVGAGVKGEAGAIQDKLEEDVDSKLEEAGVNSKLNVVGLNPGSTYLPGVWLPGKLEKDMFANLRAKLWWSLRRRFKRTYEQKMGIQEWDEEFCISIPNDNQLILELSQPKVEQNEAGKLLIESKKKMKSRGIKSGNKADSLMLTEYQPNVVFVA